jgi:hypothetical protein
MATVTAAHQYLLRTPITPENVAAQAGEEHQREAHERLRIERIQYNALSNYRTRRASSRLAPRCWG